MNNVHIRKQWLPVTVTLILALAYVGFLGYIAMDHLDRLRPDWTGLSRTVPFFAYGAMLLIVLGTSATHIQITGGHIVRFHSPLPLQPRIRIPVADVAQVLFWQTGSQMFVRYGLGVETKSGRHGLYKFFRSRDEVLKEVKRIADALGSGGQSTVKVAEIRTAFTARPEMNLLLVVAALVVLVAFYRLARF